MWGFTLLLLVGTAGAGFWLGFIAGGDITRRQLEVRTIKREQGVH